VLLQSLGALGFSRQRVDIVLELLGLLGTLPLVIREGLTSSHKDLTKRRLERRAHARDALGLRLRSGLDFSLGGRRVLSLDDLHALQLQPA